MRHGSRACFALLAALFLGMGIARGAEVSKGKEEVHVIIELPYHFYAKTFAMRTDDSLTGTPSESKDLNGSIGWGHRINRFFFDVGLSYPLFSQEKWIGTIKPYVRIQREIPLFWNQTLTPSIRLDVTPPIDETRTTMFKHDMGFNHMWKPLENLSVQQSFTLSGVNGSIVAKTYTLNATLGIGDHIVLELPRLMFLDDALGADAAIGVKLNIK